MLDIRKPAASGKTTIFAMLWLFLVFLLTVPVIRWHIAGRHEWLLSGLLLPFWAVCYWSVRAFLQLLMLNSGMGQTTVEISDLPFIPGREYQAVVAQHGHVTMKSLEASLVCEDLISSASGSWVSGIVRPPFGRSRWSYPGAARQTGMISLHDCVGISTGDP